MARKRSDHHRRGRAPSLAHVIPGEIASPRLPQRRPTESGRAGQGADAAAAAEIARGATKLEALRSIWSGATADAFRSEIGRRGVEHAAKALGIPTARITSGAGHRCACQPEHKKIAGGDGVVDVQGTGISHNELETRPRRLPPAGANVMMNTVWRLPESVLTNYGNKVRGVFVDDNGSMADIFDARPRPAIRRCASTATATPLQSEQNALACLRWRKSEIVIIDHTPLPADVARSRVFFVFVNG